MNELSRDPGRGSRPARTQAPRRTDGDRDRPGRRDDQRDVRPHGHDPTGLRHHLQRVVPRHNAVVTAKTAFEPTSEGDTGFVQATLPQSDLEKTKQIDGVAAALGGVAGEAQIIKKDGKVLTSGGAPSLGFSVDPQPAPLQLADARGGRVAEDERGRDRRGLLQEGRLRDRAADRHRLPRAGRDHEAERHRPLRRALLARRRHDRRVRPADRAAHVRQGRPARPDPRRRGERRLDASS